MRGTCVSRTGLPGNDTPRTGNGQSGNALELVNLRSVSGTASLRVSYSEDPGLTPSIRHAYDRQCCCMNCIEYERNLGKWNEKTQRLVRR